jgi:hypothetical protein
MNKDWNRRVLLADDTPTVPASCARCTPPPVRREPAVSLHPERMEVEKEWVWLLHKLKLHGGGLALDFYRMVEQM